MNKTISYNLATDLPSRSKAILSLFLQTWLDDTSTGYTIDSTGSGFFINFDNEEDAVISKIKGIPPGLEKYLIIQ